MSASGTVRIAGPGDRLWLTFFPLDPSLTFEVLPDEIGHRLRTPITCNNGSGSWELQPGDGVRPHAEGDVGVPRVQPTLCYHDDPARQRDCVLHPDRYAVVPFRGVQRRLHVSGSDTFDEVTLRWDVCCGCGRPPSGPPPEFDPRGDPCADAEARQLAIFQRMRTARELYEFAERDKVCAEGRRDGAIESRFGIGGPYAAFFAALGGLAAEFQSGGRGDFFGLLFALAAVANEPGRDSIDDAALEAATTDTVQELARDSNVRAAVRDMVREYVHTGDAPSALAGFRRRMDDIASGFGSANKILKALTVTKAFMDFHEAGWKLCDSWSLEQAWQRELWDAENEMTAADQRWNEADVELQVLRRQCPDLVPPQVPPAQQPPPADCPATPQGQPVAGCGMFTASSGAASQAPDAMASTARRATGRRSSSFVLASYSPDPPPSPAAPPPASGDPAAATALLAQIGEALKSAEAGLAELAPLVLLFSPDLGISVPRELLGTAAATAVELSEAVKADTERAIELGRTLESAAAPQ